MKKLPTPPSIQDLMVADPSVLARVVGRGIGAVVQGRYLHWEKLRHKSPPEGLNPEQWWLGIKLARMGQFRTLPLHDTAGKPFIYMLPDPVLEGLHRIDSMASGFIGSNDPLASEEHRDRFVFNSLVEEAITSSQLEGASTTRQVAVEMLRAGRSPKDHSERMILNNFMAMRSIQQLSDRPMSLERLLELHRILTLETLDDPTAAGRLQREGEHRVQVFDTHTHDLLHTPPPASVLPERMAQLVAFANGQGDGTFVHPVIRAIVLHFWIGHDHPFIDGNGRTARALFYWSMLRSRYWLFSFISISKLLKKGSDRYKRAYLESESDDNDLTYFIVHQVETILTALEELQGYLAQKGAEVRAVEARLRTSRYNHRQLALLGHALRHPGQRYTLRGHQTSQGIAYATARSDIFALAEDGLLEQRRVGGKTFEFFAPDNLQKRLDQPGE
ncbi:MAG: Fic family protein [Alphaproteobacteria bacterium CG_4_10_14_0_2_um_filter_63_37]|nr:MAG: hypothetical protein AUJ55_08280 [Proteobacteria bacterium CG1_02_64_396]PJA23585.1 MAG: Fic family protein [Alphaproteobacteria bacterium CG_4_10_14_0_2_um_filter_63_37]